MITATASEHHRTRKHLRAPQQLQSTTGRESQRACEHRLVRGRGREGEGKVCPPTGHRRHSQDNPNRRWNCQMAQDCPKTCLGRSGKTDATCPKSASEADSLSLNPPHSEGSGSGGRRGGEDLGVLEGSGGFGKSSESRKSLGGFPRIWEQCEGFGCMGSCGGFRGSAEGLGGMGGFWRVLEVLGGLQ